MMRNVGAIAAVVLLGAAGYIVYRHVSVPAPTPLDPFRREAAGLVAAQVAEKVPTDNHVEGSVLFVPLAGDKGEDEVTYQLMEAMQDAGRYNWIGIESLKAYLAKHELTMSSMRANPQVRQAALKELGADGIMSGKIISFPAPRGNARTRLHLSLELSDKAGAVIFNEKYSASVEPALFSLSYWRAWVADAGVWNRLFGWLTVVLLTPVILLTTIHKLVSKNSNTANLCLLLGLTAWSSFVAYFAVGLRTDSALAGFALLIAVVAGGFYNYVAASFVDYFMK